MRIAFLCIGLLSCSAHAADDLNKLAIASYEDVVLCVQAYGKIMSKGTATASEIAEASLWSCNEDLSKFNKLHAERLKVIADGEVPLDTLQKMTADQLAAAEVRIRRASMYSVIASRTLSTTKPK